MNLSRMLNLPVVVDDLTTTSTTDMLSANQGVEIMALLDNKAPLVKVGTNEWDVIGALT